MSRFSDPHHGRPGADRFNLSDPDQRGHSGKNKLVNLFHDLVGPRQRGSGFSTRSSCPSSPTGTICFALWANLLCASALSISLCATGRAAERARLPKRSSVYGDNNARVRVLKRRFDPERSLRPAIARRAKLVRLRLKRFFLS